MKRFSDGGQSRAAAIWLWAVALLVFAMVVVGGVIPAQDYDYLYQNGAAAIFGPGTNVLEAAFSVLGQIEGRVGNR